MRIAQGRYWRAVLGKGSDSVLLSLERETLPDDLQEARELRIDVPVGRWNTVVKLADTDRKLLGGVLLDCATHKDHVAAVVANDRLLAELQRIVRDATVALIDAGLLVLTPTSQEEA